jgi:hypothetical protein
MMNDIAQMAINTHMIQHSVSTVGANAVRGASGSGGHQGGGTNEISLIRMIKILATILLL